MQSVHYSFLPLPPPITLPTKLFSSYSCHFILTPIPSLGIRSLPIFPNFKRLLIGRNFARNWTVADKPAKQIIYNLNHQSSFMRQNCCPENSSRLLWMMCHTSENNTSTRLRLVRHLKNREVLPRECSRNRVFIRRNK